MAASSSLLSVPRVADSTKSSRRPSYDSGLSCDISISRDESVGSGPDLRQRCDLTEDVIAPAGAFSGHPHHYLPEAELVVGSHVPDARDRSNSVSGENDIENTQQEP